MFNLINMTQEELSSLLDRLTKRFKLLCEEGLQLNMARGIPSSEQLVLSSAMLDLPGANDYRAEDGTDCRSYGGVQGLAEARKLFAPLVGVPPEQVVLG